MSWHSEVTGCPVCFLPAGNLDYRTREKLERAFYPYHPRTDKLIAQRNW